MKEGDTYYYQGKEVRIHWIGNVVCGVIYKDKKFVVWKTQLKKEKPSEPAKTL